MNAAAIIGWAHSQFGKHPDTTLIDLMGKVGKDAAAAAGLGLNDIDAAVVGVFGNGLLNQTFWAACAATALPELRGKLIRRVESACATGSAAVHSGIDLLQSGQARRVLVIGAEKMTHAAPGQLSRSLLGAGHEEEVRGLTKGFAEAFAAVTENYFGRYGNKSLQLAKISAKNHQNGAGNPYAHLRKAFTVAFCNTPSDQNPMVAAPLRRTDCSMVSDGAAAIVLALEGDRPGSSPAIRFRGRAEVVESIALRDRRPFYWEGAAKAWRSGLDRANMKMSDLDVIETHDCFTIAELLQYEAMGLAAEGHGGDFVENGWRSGNRQYSINPSGGLKAKGHPIGATGVSMHALAAMQLAGEARGFQVEGAMTAGIFNMGGIFTSNYVSVLERVG